MPGLLDEISRRMVGKAIADTDPANANQPSLLGAVQDGQFWGDVGENARKIALMPTQSPYGAGNIPSEESLAKMPWLDLIALRAKYPGKADQNALAPYEHRAYMRENTRPDNALSNVAMTFGYTPYKFATGEGRSDAQLPAIGQGLLGVWEGLTK